MELSNTVSHQCSEKIFRKLIQFPFWDCAKKKKKRRNMEVNARSVFVIFCYLLLSLPMNIQQPVVKSSFFLPNSYSFTDTTSFTFARSHLFYAQNAAVYKSVFGQAPSVYGNESHFLMTYHTCSLMRGTGCGLWTEVDTQFFGGTTFSTEVEVLRPVVLWVFLTKVERMTNILSLLRDFV